MDKIQELTSKLYSEGVEKGKQEAEKIIAEANAQKKQILDEAKAKAQEIIATAEKQSAEMRSHTEAELKLFAAQATEALKTEITNLITDKLASDNVKAAMQDQTFIQKIIVELVRNWSKNEKLTIGVQNSKELETYIASNAKDILDKGLKIESINGIKSGFTLSPEDGSYKVKFGEEEFIEYFKEFLRPQVQKLLFQ
jgi:V/A-type H+-transporting ATPase subunit E